MGLLNTDELTISISFSHINKRKPAKNSNSEHAALTSDKTVPSEGLTSTTVSKTSLLWWRVLCPEREDGKPFKKIF